MNPPISASSFKVFLESRNAVLLARADLAKARSTAESVRSHLANCEADCKSLEESLTLREQHLELVNSHLQRVDVYTDMSHHQGRVAFGGFVFDGPSLVTFSGDLKDINNTVHSEALAMATAVALVVVEYPESFLEIRCDCQGAIGLIEKYLLGRAPQPLQKLLDPLLHPHRKRIIPHWIPRESPEIKFCDSLARRRLGLTPKRIPYIHLLRLVQDSSVGWTAGAQAVLHGYHRQGRMRRTIHQDNGTTIPPALRRLREITLPQGKPR